MSNGDGMRNDDGMSGGDGMSDGDGMSYCCGEGFGLVVYLLLIRRMRAVKARPYGSVKVPKAGESMLLLTMVGFWRAVMFSATPRRPK